ncbi:MULTISPECIES: ERF family protein [Pseudomonas]|uniref:ERF family protein n=1 Tax=Pseudomonas TaxID=286 RepID=UPI0025943B0F|nr:MULTISPECIES: ERF family protein [Pseudomonas]
MDITANSNIFAAFVKAQMAFGPALKTSVNPAFKSRYARLDNCIEAVIDALNNNGIGLLQVTHPDDKGVTVETLFIHESGEKMSGGIFHVPAQKQDPQGYGSALTYARRFSLMAACGIAPEDDDGEAAMQPYREKKQPAPQYISKQQLNRLEAALNACSPVVQKKFEADYPDATKMTTDVYDSIVSSLESAAKKYQERLKEEKAA